MEKLDLVVKNETYQRQIQNLQTQLENAGKETASLRGELGVARKEAKDLRTEILADDVADELEEELEIKTNQLLNLEDEKQNLEAIVECLKNNITGVSKKLGFVEDVCTKRGVKISVLEKELGALRAYEEASKAIISKSNIQDLRRAKESAEKELNCVRNTLDNTRMELSEKESMNWKLRTELKHEKPAQRALAAMLQTRDRENQHQAAVIKYYQKTIAVLQHELHMSTMAYYTLHAELANEKNEDEADSDEAEEEEVDSRKSEEEEETGELEVLSCLSSESEETDELEVLSCSSSESEWDRISDGIASS